MSLNWKWDRKVGELTFTQTFKGEETKEFTVNLYQGNAVLIMIHEWTEESDAGEKEMYNVWRWWADKDHMKRTLGLTKDPDCYNIFDQPTSKVTRIRINKARSSYYKDIVSALVKAFDEITIEVYSEE